MNAAKRVDIRYCLITILILAVAYGICQNGQWVPGGGDGAFYLTIGRNLAKGNGFIFGGMPVTLVPPGWPGVLAAVMSFASSFVWLNLMLMVFCLSAACIWYFILRRYASPGRAMLIVLIAGTLVEWHRFSFTNSSEALFFFLFAAAMLAAFRITEGKRSIWRIAGVVLISISMIEVRWAGLLALLPIVGVLAEGRIKPKWNRQCIAAILVLALGLGAFIGTRVGLAKYAVWYGARAGETVRPGTVLPIDVLSHGLAEFSHRFVAAGDWPFLLLWPPGVAAQSSQMGKFAVDLLGWALILFFLHTLLSAMKKRSWVWLGVLLYCGIICMMFSRPIARYLAPMAPLLLLGIWLGAETFLKSVHSMRCRRLIHPLIAMLLISTVACNLSILLFNAWIAQSPKFQDLCLAGEYGEILQVSEYLNRHAIRDNQLGLCVQYHDLIRKGSRGGWAFRAILFLTDKRISRAPRELAKNPTKELILIWAKAKGLKFVLARPSKPASRIWHLRLPLGRGSLDGSRRFYVLYEVKSDRLAATDLPEISSGLRKVPEL